MQVLLNPGRVIWVAASISNNVQTRRSIKFAWQL